MLRAVDSLLFALLPAGLLRLLALDLAAELRVLFFPAASDRHILE
ncbi:hypothetical protein [Pseudonocardia sp. H11422]|nr:hypothetical protein [Pseudonocardia sp. H11422]